LSKVHYLTSKIFIYPEQLEQLHGANPLLKTSIPKGFLQRNLVRGVNYLVKARQLFLRCSKVWAT